MPSSTAWSARFSVCWERLEEAVGVHEEAVGVKGPVMSTFFHKLLHVLRRSRDDADLREEIETHRALRQAALERDGIAPEEASRESHRAMGNVTLAVEDVRDVRDPWLARAADSVSQDVRIALRGLRKSPGFTLVAIITLALGIGANTALFSIFNGLILRPLPVREPANLAVLTDGSHSYPLWQQFRAISDEGMFDGALAWSNQSFDLSQGGQTALVDGSFVTGSFFEMLGVSAARGRMLTPADDSSAAPDGPVAVISQRFWREHFGGAGDVIGRRLTIQRTPFTIVGVTPPGFFGVDVGRTANVILPFAAEPLLRGRESRLPSIGSSWLDIMVRLRPGQSIEQANIALQAAQPRIREATVDLWVQNGGQAARYLNRPMGLVLAATGNSSLRNRFERPLSVMVVAVGLVLLVACANIASLLVARALARRRELSVRLALGGSRWRLARLLFVESLIVAVAGAALGLAFAMWGSALLVQQLNTWQNSVSLELPLDWRVLGFTALLACLSAVAAGVAPVIGLKSVAAGEALRDAGRSVMGDRRFAVRGTLVVGQIAVSLVLVITAGLLLRSFVSLNQLPLGFVPEPLLVVDLNLQASGAPPETRAERVERLRDAAAAVPGVRSASVSTVRLLSGGGWATNSVAIDDGPMTDDRSVNRLWRNATTPGWFETMGIPVIEGRDFNPDDRIGGPLVAIVNPAFARRYNVGPRIVGRTIRLGSPGGELRYEIVGLVGDTAYTAPRDGMIATMYVPVTQRAPGAYWSSVLLTINAAPGQRAAVEREVAAALTRTEPHVPFTFRTFDQYIEATVTRERVVAMLSGFFGGLALLLAAIGLYGVVAQAVRMRRSEIGLRMALGARPAGIIRLVFRRVGVLIAAGLALGLASSAWAAKFVAPLLFEVEARDPSTFAGAAAVLITVSVLAAWVPARRAARLDPSAALRDG
jgi:putative ABC transport system permease protein